MVDRLTQGRVRWVNMKAPTPAEIKKVMTELDIPPFFMADISTPNPKGSAQLLDSAIKISLDFPVVKHSGLERQHEVKCIVTKHNLLTIQYAEMDGIDNYKRQIEIATTIRKKQTGLTGVHLFTALMGSLYDSVSSEIDYLESRLSHIEDHIFKHDERRMVREIAMVGKALITFRHILRGHEDVLREASPLFDKVYKSAFADEIKNMQGQFFALQRRTNTLFDTHTALRETNTALLSTRQNEIIKNLTIMAFITFPLTLISSMFGMEAVHTPIIGSKGDFWIIAGIMILVLGVFLGFFKHKKWI